MGTAAALVGRTASHSLWMPWHAIGIGSEAMSRRFLGAESLLSGGRPHIWALAGIFKVRLGPPCCKSEGAASRYTRMPVRARARGPSFSESFSSVFSFCRVSRVTRMEGTRKRGRGVKETDATVSSERPESSATAKRKATIRPGVRAEAGSCCERAEREGRAA